MQNLLDIIDWGKFKDFLPVMTALLAAYIAYRYGLRKYYREENEKTYKKVRESLSTILIIWNEFNQLKFLIENNEPSSELVYKIPGVAKTYLKLDEEKIKRLILAYNTSIESIKEIDVTLYFSLESSLDPLEKIMNEVLLPILSSEEGFVEDKKDVFLPLLNDCIQSLDHYINKLKQHIPKKERKAISDLMESRIRKLVNPNEIPDFLINLINKLVPLKEAITKDEMALFYNNSTIVWIMGKLLNTNLQSAIKLNSLRDMITLLNTAKSIQEQNQLFSNFDEDEFVLGLVITQEEERQHFQNNKPFYYLIMGLIAKISGNVSLNTKKNIVKLNSGKVSLYNELELKKADLILKAR